MKSLKETCVVLLSWFTSVEVSMSRKICWKVEATHYELLFWSKV